MLLPLAGLLERPAVVGEHLHRVERRSTVRDLLRTVRELRRQFADTGQVRVVVVEHLRMRHAGIVESRAAVPFRLT